MKNCDLPITHDLSQGKTFFAHLLFLFQTQLAIPRTKCLKRMNGFNPSLLTPIFLGNTLYLSNAWITSNGLADQVYPATSASCSFSLATCKATRSSGVGSTWQNCSIFINKSATSGSSTLLAKENQASTLVARRHFQHSSRHQKSKIMGMQVLHNEI